MFGDEMSYDASGRLRWGSEAAGLLLVERHSHRVLLVKRSMSVQDPGVWAVPGGRVEPGQSLYAAARTEVVEELGSLPFIRLRYQDTYRSGGFTYVTFVATVDDAVAQEWQIELDWENDDYGWFSLDKLPTPLHPNVQRVLNELCFCSKRGLVQKR